MRRFVVVTGLPASGKTTVGRAIAASLELPFIDKDEILEDFFEATAPGNPDERRALSRIADESFQARALASSGAVLASWWKHPRSRTDSGTSTLWLPPLDVIEVHCVCSPGIALERFIARTRHRGHLDALRTPADLHAQFTEQASLGPLASFPLIQISTDAAVDIPLVKEQIKRIWTSR